MNTYIESLKSTNPTPGGGSVSGVLTELSCALLHMACAISIKAQNDSSSKAKELSDIVVSLEKKIQKAHTLSQKDEHAYAQVAAAFKVKATSPEEKHARTTSIQTACKSAAEVPCEVIELALETMKLTCTAEPLVNTSLLSDIAIVTCILQAAVRSSVYLVHANLPYMESKDARGVYLRAHGMSDEFISLASEQQARMDDILLQNFELKEAAHE